MATLGREDDGEMDQMHGMSGIGAMPDMRKRLWDYWAEHTAGMVADDAVFHELGSGRDFRGSDEIDGMFQWFYHVAFDAHAVPKKVIYDEQEGSAAVAGRIIGRHIGEFAGVPATNQEINVRMCVTYALRDGKISEAWVYFNTPEFLRQVGAVPS